MKFGETIIRNSHAPWAEHYLEYNALKKLISLIRTSLEMEQVGDSVGQDLVDHKLRHSIFFHKWDQLRPQETTNSGSNGRTSGHNGVGDDSKSENDDTDPLQTIPPSSPTINSKKSKSTRTSFLKSKTSGVSTGKSYSSVELAKYFAYVLDSELIKISQFIRTKRRELDKECDDIIKKSNRVKSLQSPSHSKSTKHPNLALNHDLQPITSTATPGLKDVSVISSSSSSSSASSSSGSSATNGVTPAIKSSFCLKTSSVATIQASYTNKQARGQLEKVHILVTRAARNKTESQLLGQFVELNYTGFFKILKKYDKKVSSYHRRCARLRQSRKEEEKTKHHAGNVKSNVIISNMKSSMKVRNEKDLSRPILPIFMAKVDQERLLASSMCLIKSKLDESRQSVTDLKKKQNNVKLDIEQGFKFAKKAIKTLSPDRTKEEVNSNVNHMKNSSSIGLNGGDIDGIGNHGDHGSHGSHGNTATNTTTTGSRTLTTRDDSNHESTLIFDASNLTTTVAMENVKRKVFRSMFEEIVGVLQTMDPDKAKGIEQLMMAHDAMFGRGDDNESDVDSDVDEQKYNDDDDNRRRKTSPPTFKTMENHHLVQHGGENSDTASTSSEESQSSTYSSASSNDSQSDESNKKRFNRYQYYQLLKAFLLYVFRLIPSPSILKWLPKYHKKYFSNDVISSICISIFGIPQALAYASLIGIDPGAGLYAVIFPAILYPIMGWSRTAAIGPMSVPCLYMGAIADELGYLPNTTDRWNVVIAMAFWSGVFCSLLGLLKMAALVDFVSQPVLKGFAAASGILVSLHTVDSLFGLDIHPKRDESGFKIFELSDNIYQLFAQLGNTVPIVFISSIFLVLFYVSIKFLSKKITLMEKDILNENREKENTEDKEMMLLKGGSIISEGSGQRGKIYDKKSKRTEASKTESNGDRGDDDTGDDGSGDDGSGVGDEKDSSKITIQSKNNTDKGHTVCQRKIVSIFSTLCVVFPPLVLLALTGTLLGGIMCNFHSNVDAFGVLLEQPGSINVSSSDLTSSGSNNCTIKTVVTTTITTTTTAISTVTTKTNISTIESSHIVSSPSLCQNNSNSIPSEPKLICNGMVMVGWLPDLLASIGKNDKSSTNVTNMDISGSSTTSSGWSSFMNLSIILPSIPLAFLIMIEHMINVNLYASLIHDHPSVDNNLELVALGTTNVVSALFSSFGTGAGFSRTSLNYKSGAKTQMSSVLSSIVTLLMIIGLRSIIQFLPKLVLSIMILFAVAGLIDYKTLIRYYYVSKWDCATMSVTLMMTLFLGVANGVLASIGFSILVFINYAQNPNISRLGRYFGRTEYAPAVISKDSNSTTDGTVVFISKALVIRFESPLFFANCRTLSKMLSQELLRRMEADDDTSSLNLSSISNGEEGNDAEDAIVFSTNTKNHRKRKGGRKKTKWKACIIDFGSVGWIDITAADIMKTTIQLFGKNGYPIYLARCNQMTTKMLEGAGVVNLLELHGGGLKLFVHDAVKEALLLKKKSKR